MEEDIKILEDLIEWTKEEGIEACGMEKELPALEHLIKAYKELEEKLDETLNANLALVQGNANSIPVSLVEEKIEELIKEGRHYNANKIEVLQELLEKRK